MDHARLQSNGLTHPRAKARGKARRSQWQFPEHRRSLRDSQRWPASKPHCRRWDRAIQCEVSVGDGLKMAKEEVPKSVHPDQRFAEASARVRRLEAALSALGEDDPDAEPLKSCFKAGKDSRSSAPGGRTPRFVSPVHCPSEEASRSSTGAGASSPRSPAADGGEVGQWASRFGDSACRSIKTSCSTSRTKQATPRDGGGSTRGDCETASPSGRAPGWPRQSRGRIVPTKESQNWWEFHRWTSFDVDRHSRFHVEGSRQSPPLIRTRYGLRGIRVGEASHPGPRVRRRRRVGSSPDSTMSEDLRLLDSLARDLGFDGDVPTTVKEVDVTMHDGSSLGPSEQVLSTVPASSGAVRRLVLVRNSEDVHSTVPVMDLTMLDSESDRGSQNSAPSPHVPVGNDEGPISEVGSVLGQDAIIGESDTESLRVVVDGRWRLKRNRWRLSQSTDEQSEQRSRIWTNAIWSFCSNAGHTR